VSKQETGSRRGPSPPDTAQPRLPGPRALRRFYLPGRTGLSFTANEIVITCGAAGALNTALKAISEPGDEIIIFAPFFQFQPEPGSIQHVIKKYPDIFVGGFPVGMYFIKPFPE
jgi:hypothetical protein